MGGFISDRFAKGGIAMGVEDSQAPDAAPAHRIFGPIDCGSCMHTNDDALCICEIISLCHI